MRFRSTLTWTVSLALSGILFGYTNCSRVDFDGRGQSIEATKSSETIVGNPIAAKSLLARMCNVITRCHTEISYSACEDGVLASSGIDYQLGLPVGSVATYADILQEEDNGVVQADRTALYSCQSAVDALACSDGSVQGAYTPNSADPFSGVALMVPTAPGSCPAVFSKPPARAEYYVSPSGSDFNDGSFEKPWATIVHASEGLTLGPDGAIVHVAPGNYAFTNTTNCITPARPCAIATHRSGTATAPITYISDQQWAAKISSSGATTGWYNSGDYVKIVGFEFVGAAENEFGILTEGAYNQIIGNHIHDIPVTKNCSTGGTSAGAIYLGYFAKSHHNDVIGNLIHDIGPVKADGLPNSNYCRLANGINIEQPFGKIQNNIIYRVATSGIETWNNASNLEITNNLIFNSGHKTDLGIAIGGALLLGADSSVTTHKGTVVANNIFRNNLGFALHESNVSASNQYKNNLLYANGKNFEITSGITPVGTLTTDPLMVDFRINGGGNLRLQPASPAINAADANAASSTTDFAGFARPYDGTPDIGPYEWHP